MWTMRVHRGHYRGIIYMAQVSMRHFEIFGAIKWNILDTMCMVLFTVRDFRVGIRCMALLPIGNFRKGRICMVAFTLRKFRRDTLQMVLFTVGHYMNCTIY